MTSIFAFPVHLPVRWPIDTKDPIRAAQIRVLLNTVVTDALAAWRAAPERTWADIGALVYRQLRTLDVLYPEAGILDTPARAVAVQFFATNVHSSIRNLRYRDGDMPNPALARLCRALRSCPKTANGQRSENANRVPRTCPGACHPLQLRRFQRLSKRARRARRLASSRPPLVSRFPSFAVLSPRQ
jgi:hypothetical protein